MLKYPKFNLRSGIYFSQGRRVFKIMSVWHSAQGTRCEFIDTSFLDGGGQVMEGTKDDELKKFSESKMKEFMEQGIIQYIGEKKPKF